jgi:hypothetical protein
VNNGKGKKMKILKFKAFEKNTLRGFIEVELPSGMIVKEISWHQRDDREWLGLPARQFEKEDGSKSWANQVDFATKELYWKFVDAVLNALREYLETGKDAAA